MKYYQFLIGRHFAKRKKNPIEFNFELVYMWRRFVSAMLRIYAPFFFLIFI